MTGNTCDHVVEESRTAPAGPLAHRTSTLRVVAALLTALVTSSLAQPAVGAQESGGDTRGSALTALAFCFGAVLETTSDLSDAARHCLNEVDGFDGVDFDECWVAEGSPLPIRPETATYCLQVARAAWLPPSERPTTPRQRPRSAPPTTLPGAPSPHGESGSTRARGRYDFGPGLLVERDEDGNETIVVDPNYDFSDSDFLPTTGMEEVSPWTAWFIALAFASAVAGLAKTLRERRAAKRQADAAAALAAIPPAAEVSEPTAVRDRAHLVAALTELRDRVPSEALRAEITLRLEKVDVDPSAAASLPGAPAPSPTTDRAHLVAALVALHDIVSSEELRAEITAHLASVGVEPEVPASGRPGWSDRGTELRPGRSS